MRHIGETYRFEHRALKCKGGVVLLEFFLERDGGLP